MSDLQMKVFEQNLVPDYLREVGLNDLTKSLLTGGGGSGNKRISIRGKKFRLVVDGEEMSTIKQEHLDVVIVNATKDVARTYYAQAYDPKAEATPPDCWSKDGTVPDASIAEPQARKCEACPQNIKGSGQGNSRACRFSKRIAIALADDINAGVYQLNLASTSIFGGDDIKDMPFNKYVKFVAAQGYSIDTMVTTMYFDDDSDSPRVFFVPRRFLTKDEYEVTAKLGKSQEAINAVSMTVAQSDNTAKPVALPTPKAEKPVVEEPAIEEPTVRKTAKKEEAPVSSKSDLSDILSKFAKVQTPEPDDEE